MNFSLNFLIPILVPVLRTMADQSINATSSVRTTMDDELPSSVPLSCTIIREYGVLHLRGALSKQEQLKLLHQIRGDIITRPATNPIPANFHISSGKVGAKQRNESLHQLGEVLYSRFANAVAAQLTPGETASEPSLSRIAKVHSGE